MRALLLDNTYFPVRIVSWQKAMILILTNRAEIVEEYDDKLVRSVSQSFNLPKIIKLFARHKNNQFVKFTRFNLFLRDNFQCQYCCDKFPVHKLTFDHVIPQSKGGRTSWQNVVACCHPCNLKKSNKSPEQVGMRLFRIPKQPSWSPQLCLRIRRDDPKEWGDWLPRVSSA